MSDDFDEAFAAQLIGAHVLVGITHYDLAGNVERVEQFHGRVVKAAPGEGVTIVDGGGQERWLPPHRDSYEPADPGEYRLRSTGEVVRDPDYLSTWDVYPPRRQ